MAKRTKAQKRLDRALRRAGAEDDRYNQRGHWFAPASRRIPGEIELDGSDLVWRTGLDGRFGPAPRYQEHEADILWAFVALADSDDGRDVLRFAERWGVLELCEHGKPYWHMGPEGEPSTCQPIMREPLEAWRSYAQRARALLAVAAHVQQREPGHLEDWATFYGPELAADRPIGESAEVDGLYLTEALTGWLSLGRVGARAQWSEWRSRPELTVAAPTLFGAIARELAFQAGRVDGLYTCDGCGYPFSPARKPRAGERTWCIDCREAGEPERAAKRDAREREGATVYAGTNRVPRCADCGAEIPWDGKGRPMGKCEACDPARWERARTRRAASG